MRKLSMKEVSLITGGFGGCNLIPNSIEIDVFSSAAMEPMQAQEPLLLDKLGEKLNGFAGLILLFITTPINSTVDYIETHYNPPL